ncbi:MAG: TonB-dependent receptor [Candidatus Kryptoniota bacterium]
MKVPGNFLTATFLATSLVYIIYQNSFSQTLHGTVLDEDSVAIANATVSIPVLQQTTSTDHDGKFIISNIPKGTYLIKAQRIGFDSVQLNVTVSSESTFILLVMRGNFVTVHTVTVTAKPQPSDIANSSQSVSVIQERQLLESTGSAVGAELSDLPGVSMVHSGPFSVKPVIDGLGYQRVVILEDGERHDYQSWDDDDSPGIDVLSMNRIEVVRGPNSVLYGSDALGGVVNFIHDDRTLGNSDSSAMRGEVVLNGFSNNTEGAAHAALSGATSLANYYADVTVRGAGNVRTPRGVLPNTGAAEVSFEGTVSTEREWGNLLLGYSRFDQDREILPVGDDSGGTPYQNTVHDRFRFSYKSQPSPLQVSLDGVFQRNDAAEYEDDDDPSPENHLLLQSLSVDSKLYYNGSDNNSGTVGISSSEEQNFTFVQADPVIPAYHQSTAAAFIFDDYKVQTLDVSAGVRYDYRTLKTSDNATLDLVGQTRSYQAVTGSVGVLWHASDEISFGADVGSGWRAPEVEELFISGLQEGSFMYKLGNPDLEPEQSFSTDFLTRITGSIVVGELSAYYNRISRYIFLGPTGEIDSASGVPKYTEQQANATLTGVDGQLCGKITAQATLTIGGDFLLARNNDAGTWLPLTPANRLMLELKYNLPSISFVNEPYCSGEAHIVFDQNRIDPSETTTSGYTVFDVGFGGTIRIFERPATVDFQIHNLLNRAYHDNMSLYKLYAFEPGFDFSMAISVPFVIVQ